MEASVWLGILAHADGFHHHGGGWMWLWWPLGILALAAITAVVTWAIARWLRDEARRPQARQILDERYARGEISTEEYRERLRELE